MAPQTNGGKIEIDRVKPFSSLDAYKDDGLKKAHKWMNTQLLIKEVHLQKGTLYFLRL